MNGRALELIEEAREGLRRVEAALVATNDEEAALEATYVTDTVQRLEDCLDA